MHDKTAECFRALSDYKRLLGEMAAVEHTLRRALDAISAERSNIRSGHPPVVPSRTRSALPPGQWPTATAIEALLVAIRAEKLIAQAAWRQAPADERARLDFPIAWHPERPAVPPASRAPRIWTEPTVTKPAVTSASLASA